LDRGTFLCSLEMDLQLGITRVGVWNFDDKRTSIRIRSFTQGPVDLLSSEFDVVNIKVAGIQDDLLAAFVQPLHGQRDFARTSLVVEFDG
jgi:hypothetical protein